MKTLLCCSSAHSHIRFGVTIGFPQCDACVVKVQLHSIAHLHVKVFMLTKSVEEERGENEGRGERAGERSDREETFGQADHPG